MCRLLCPMGFWAISISSHFESGSCHNLNTGEPRSHQLWIPGSLKDWFSSVVTGKSWEGLPSLTVLGEKKHTSHFTHWSSLHVHYFGFSSSKDQQKALIVDYHKKHWWVTSYSDALTMKHLKKLYDQHINVKCYDNMCFLIALKVQQRFL